MHIQLSELFESLTYCESVKLAHCLWNHFLHSLQYIPLWLLLTALQHLPHGYLTGPGLTSMSPEIASKSTIIAMLTRDSLMYTLGGEKIAGTVETLEMMVPPLVYPNLTYKKCVHSQNQVIFILQHT